MVGKNCVAIASDRRYGIRHQTVAMNMERIFKIHDSCYLGLSGLATDVQTVHEKLKFRTNLYKLREDRDIKPSAFANLVSSLLYEKRYAIWPRFILDLVRIFVNQLFADSKEKIPNHLFVHRI